MDEKVLVTFTVVDGDFTADWMGFVRDDAQVWGMSVDGFDILPNENFQTQTVAIAKGVIPEAVTVCLKSRRIES